MISEKILSELNIDEEVLNIYSYGSKIYGTDNEESDSDYIIVTKGSMLKSGAFKQNAISNIDRSIQGIIYSRSGFIHAINSYDISALECLSLGPDFVVQSRWPFKVQKWDNKEMAKAIISKASNSWHLASINARDGWNYMAKKGIFHAIRILSFGKQLKDNKKITDFKCCNIFWNELKSVDDENFHTKNYLKKRDLLIDELRS